MIFLNRHRLTIVRGTAALFGSLCVLFPPPGRAALDTKTNSNRNVASQVKAVEPVLLPAGVTDSAGEIGFIQNPVHGITEVNLSTGKIIWISADAESPLIRLRGFRLAAMKVVNSNSIRVVILDGAHGGKKLLESEPVTFPGWVNVNEGYGHSFHLSVKTRGENLLLFWEAHSQYSGGAAPPPEVEKAARKDAAGAFRVRLASGRVEMLPDGKDPDEPPSIVPPILRGITSHLYWTGASWEYTPLIIGNELKALAQVTEGDQQTLSLQSWDLTSGRLLSVTTLMTGLALWPQLTLDGGTLMVRQTPPSGKLPPSQDLWTFFSLKTGERLARFQPRSIADEVSVVNGHLFTIAQSIGISAGRVDFVQWVTPRSLEAINLKTHAVLWTLPVLGLATTPMPS